MNQITNTPKTTTCLMFFLISFYILISSSLDRTNYASSYCASILPFLLVFLLAILIIFAVRTTIVTWITVVVLLAFAGKRRRVLAKEGSKITSDVTMYLVKVLVKDKGLLAFAFAAVMSLTIMASL